MTVDDEFAALDEVRAAFASGGENPSPRADELVRAWYFLLTHRHCLLNDVDPEPQQAAEALAQVALSFAFHISERPDGCFEDWAGDIVKVNAASMKGARDFVYKNDLDAPLWRNFPADKWQRLTEKERQMLLPEGHAIDDPTGEPKGRAN